MSVEEILEEIQKLSWIEKEHLRAALDSDEGHPAVLEAVDKGRLSLKAGPTYTADEVRAKLREWVSKQSSLTTSLMISGTLLPTSQRIILRLLSHLVMRLASQDLVAQFRGVQATGVGSAI